MCNNLSLKYPVEKFTSAAIKILFFTCYFIYLSACSASIESQIERAVPVLHKQLEAIEHNIANNALPNAWLVKIYVAILQQQSLASVGVPQTVQDILNNAEITSHSKKVLLQYYKPVIPVLLAKVQLDKLPNLNRDELKLVSALAVEVTPQAVTLQNFRDRLKSLVINPHGIGSKQDIISEIEALLVATSLDTYNNSLVDILNVLADISTGALPSINQATTLANSQRSQPGSHLVGNTNYGSWQNSGGSSIWVWYLQYRLFSSLVSRPYYYHSWYYQRPYSYYNDYGRSAYSSKKTVSDAQNVDKRNAVKTKKYGSANNLRRSAPSMQQRRVSSYASASQRLGGRSRSRFSGK